MQQPLAHHCLDRSKSQIGVVPCRLSLVARQCLHQNVQPQGIGKIGLRDQHWQLLVAEAVQRQIAVVVVVVVAQPGGVISESAVDLGQTAVIPKGCQQIDLLFFQARGKFDGQLIQCGNLGQVVAKLLALVVARHEPKVQALQRRVGSMQGLPESLHCNMAAVVGVVICQVVERVQIKLGQTAISAKDIGQKDGIAKLEVSPQRQRLQRTGGARQEAFQI